MAPKKPISAESRPSTRSTTRSQKKRCRPARITTNPKVTKGNPSKKVGISSHATQLLSVASNTRVTSEIGKKPPTESLSSKAGSKRAVAPRYRQADEPIAEIKASAGKKGQKSFKPRSRDKKKIPLFLHLPAELRNMIYEHLLVAPTDIQLTQDSQQYTPRDDVAEFRCPAIKELHPAIARTCKLLHAEASPVLYAKNTFVHGIPMGGQLYLPLRYLRWMGHTYFRFVIDVRASNFLENFIRAEAQLELLELSLTVWGCRLYTWQPTILETTLSTSSMAKSISKLTLTSEVVLRTSRFLTWAEGLMGKVTEALERNADGKVVCKTTNESKSETTVCLKLEDKTSLIRLSHSPR